VKITCRDGDPTGWKPLSNRFFEPDAPRDRSCARSGGALRGISPALAEEALGRMGLSRCARGILVFASKARCGPIPLRLGVFWRSAGSVLRSLRKLGGGRGFRAVREGILLFASKARYGPIPLRLAYGALRGIGPALAEEALGRMGFSRCARGDFVVRLQGSLRTDPAPLGEAFGVPQRGTAYQPGVKPRVWRTTGAF